MKRITILIFTTIIWTFCSAQNDIDTSENKNFFYLNPLPFIDNTFQLNYELLTSKTTGLLISFGYTFNANKVGGNGEIQFRIYLSDTKNKARKLFYVSPFARFQYIESTIEYYHWDYVRQESVYVDMPDVYVNAYSGGLLLGFKWVLNSQFTIDTYFGGGIKVSTYTGKKASKTMDMSYYGYYNGPIPKLGVQFGYNF